MSDVYKFRITIDLELATHERPKDVRDFLRTFIEEELVLTQAKLDGAAIYDPRTGLLTTPSNVPNMTPLDGIHRFDVRTKRLDDWAPIGPDLTLRIAAATCPHCQVPFAAHEVNRMPFTCPTCKKVIRVDGDGRVIA